MDERVLAEANGIYRWEGPKRKQTLFSARLGRVVLTSQRLLFLSTGKHDVTVGKLVAGAAGNHYLAQRTADTGHLDLSSLDSPGSLALPLDRVVQAELKGMFKVMTVTYLDDAGATQATTFAPKNGGMPAGASWLAEIEAAKAALRA